MKKRLFLPVAVLFFSFVLFSCGEDQVKLFSDHVLNIPYLSAGVDGDLSSRDESPSFKEIIGKNEINDLPYIGLTENIYLRFQENPPQTVFVTDVLLDDAGNNKYGASTAFHQQIEVQGNEIVYLFNVHPAVALSSNSADYEAGKTLRGITFLCDWGNHTVQYDFVVRTDAKQQV